MIRKIHFQGLTCAHGYELFSVTQQAKLTAIAINLKQIAVLGREEETGIEITTAAFLDLGNLSTAVQDVWLFAQQR